MLENTKILENIEIALKNHGKMQKLWQISPLNKTENDEYFLFKR
ncbi:hypothetical protein [Okeania sp. KiyG1]|nr:hypothetical protein [Okeania sp. KiyG1]